MINLIKIDRNIICVLIEEKQNSEKYSECPESRFFRAKVFLLN
jgi:hypothetical protein